MYFYLIDDNSGSMNACFRQRKFVPYSSTFFCLYLAIQTFFLE